MLMMERRHTWRRVAGAAALAGLLCLFGADRAAAICDPARAHTIAGSFSGAYQYTGGADNYTQASATIPYYIPFVDAAYGGSTSVWPMVADATCGGFGLVQAGEVELWNPYSQSFVEWENCHPAPPNGPYVLPAFGQVTHTYVAQHNPSVGGGPLVQAYVDGNATLPQPGAATDWWGNSAQYFQETHTYDDQGYGGYNNRQLVSALGICTYAGGTYNCGNPTGTELHTQAWLANNMVAGSVATRTQFTVWDTKCAS